MKIGIDIDNVISNFTDMVLDEYFEHDKELRNAGVVHPDENHRNLFDWSKEEENKFYLDNIERIAKKLKPIHHAKKIIDQLQKDGNQIYIITGRENGEYSNARKLTEEWLEKYEISYDELIFTNAYHINEKTQECLKYKIDIMIEDNARVCLDLEQNGIRTILMNTRFNQKYSNLNRAFSWKEIYEKISSMYPKQEVEKVKIILDTDTYNETDDQFALAYLLKSRDQFQIEAITIAPYHHDNGFTIGEGQEKSYQEVLKIAEWLNFETENKVFKGSSQYFSENSNQTNEAVEKIIEIALKNEKTYLLAIGAITNVALAIKKEPEIVNKIEVIWLGGNSLLSKDNEEFNFRQDIEAVREVFESKVRLTIIPCKNVASNLRTSIYEVEHYLKGKDKIGDYLCQRFYNDGVHGIQERRVIWDISVIAYMINKNWFEVEEISCPNIMPDTSYELTNNKHKITMVQYLNVDKIYEDLFKKLG